MAINVGAANYQASQMNDNVNKLRSAKRNLLDYKASISSNWVGKEVNFYLTAIDQAVAQIDSIINQINSIGNDINNTASAIKREEDAAAAAARARAAREARAARIRKAQAEYDEALEQYNALSEKQALYEEVLSRKLSRKEREHYTQEYEELLKALDDAKAQLETCDSALVAARR